jgi:hypothetical protein
VRLTTPTILCALGLAGASLLSANVAPASAQESAEESAPTWYSDVLPIFQERCQVCHREGSIGPFALDSYDDAAGWSAMIGEVVENRRMPPWHAAPDVGHFENDRALPDDERATILGWVEAGAPAGDPADAPPAREWPDGGWALGTPDEVIAMPRAIPVPASGVVDYQYVEIPTDFGEDKWVRAMQVMIGAREVVHHVLIFVRYPRSYGRSPRVRGGLEGYFCSALPGDDVEPFPPGAAKLLPRGSSLIFQLHYTPNGRAQEDLSQLGLYFMDDPNQVTRRARTVALYDTHFTIPAGAPDHTVRARYRFDQDSILYGLTPHMHLRGKSFRYLLLYPDGSYRPLLHIPVWDFNWQNTYRLAQPLFIPSGSTVLGVAAFDNSADNPANPDPDRDVGFGEQTWDEMMIGYMDVIQATPEERAAWEAEQAAAAEAPGSEGAER